MNAIGSGGRTANRAAAPEVAFSVLFLGFGLYLLLPLVGVALFAVATTWFDTVLPVGYTVDHIAETIQHPQFLPTHGRSLVASLATVVASVVLMTPTLFLVHVAAPRLRPAIELLSLLPFALPTVVLALSLIRTYSEPPVTLSGTPTLLIIAYVVIGLPFIYRALDNSLRSIDTRVLSEASATLGASLWVTFRRVILPSIRPGIVAGSLLVFAVSFGEFTLSLFLVGDAWLTSGVWTAGIWDYKPHVTTVLLLIDFAMTWLISLVIQFGLRREETTETVMR